MVDFKKAMDRKKATGRYTEPRVWHKNDPNVPPDAVYVGRPTKWGNPWSHVGSRMDHVVLVKTRSRAVGEYFDWFHGETRYAEEMRRACRLELKGKDLTCWCAPEECHADILLDYANGTD